MHTHELCYYIYLGRGYISEENSGGNHIYYIVENIDYYTISSRGMVDNLYYYVVSISKWDYIRSFSCHTISGVQDSRIMFYVTLGGRGWISSSDSGANSIYYLYIGVWYRTLSPNRLSADSCASVNRISGSGIVGSNDIYSPDSGVQIHELC